jgi:hypothetical protein
MRDFPIISVDEPEMLKTYNEYLTSGFKPISLKLRSVQESETKSIIREEVDIPREFGKTRGNKPINIREVHLVDTYGKKMALNHRNPQCIEKYVRWYLRKFPVNQHWNSRVEIIEFQIIKEGEWKNCFLRFKRGISMKITGETNTYSLIWNGLRKPSTRKWLDETAFSDAQMKIQTDDLADSYCKINYRETESKTPQCSI